jgi:polysaccharide biosynthesis protein PslH
VSDGLLFVARRPPWPLTNGGRIRAHRLLRALSTEFRTTLLTFAHDAWSADGALDREELEASLPRVELVTVTGLGPGKRGDQLLSLVRRRRSWNFGRYELPALRAALHEAFTDDPPAIVHFDDPGVARFGPLERTVSVYAPHNVEHQILQQAAVHASGARRFFNAVDARRVAGEERDAWRRFDLCVAVSELDARVMRAGGARRVEICPNATDPVTALSPPTIGADEPLRLLFVGSGAYGPYERGVAWLVGEVLPALRDIVPAVLDHVGAPPRRPVRAEGVTYHGFVDSVTPHYERAHVVVVPVFEGSGTRLKVIEAMAHGRPVVSTSLGAAGLPVRPGEHYVCADDASAFANRLAELAAALRDAPEIEARRLARARDAVEPLLWPHVGVRLARLYLEELRRTRL